MSLTALVASLGVLGMNIGSMEESITSAVGNVTALKQSMAELQAQV